MSDESKRQYGVADGILVNGRTVLYAVVREERIRDAFRKEIDAVKQSASMS